MIKKITKTYRIDKSIDDFLKTFEKENNFESQTHLVNTILRAFVSGKINIKKPNLSLNLSSKKETQVKLKKGDNNIIHYKNKVYNETEGKECSKCKKWKPFNEFYKNNRKKKQVDGFGYRSQCKDCENKKKKIIIFNNKGNGNENTKSG